MAFCKNCGTKLEDGAKFCPNCGTAADAAPKAESFKEEASKAASELNEKLSELNNTADTTSEFSQNDINSNKFMSILAYIGILVLIPIFCAKDSKFARFHTNQGATLAVVELVCGILGKIPLLGIFFRLIGLICFVLAIIGIVNVCNGKAKELPIIGKYTFIK